MKKIHPVQLCCSKSRNPVCLCSKIIDFRDFRAWQKTLPEKGKSFLDLVPYGMGWDVAVGLGGMEQLGEVQLRDQQC